MKIENLIQYFAVDFFFGFDISRIRGRLCQIYVSNFILGFDFRKMICSRYFLYFLLFWGKIDLDQQILVDRSCQIEYVLILDLRSKLLFLKAKDILQFLKLERIKHLLAYVDIYQLFWVTGFISPLNQNRFSRTLKIKFIMTISSVIGYNLLYFIYKVGS